jgi:hypothetical protein
MADTRSYGARFASHRMAANYRFRPDYSSEVYDTLAGLLQGQPRALLDAGCGPGKIVRGLADQLDRADAVTLPKRCCASPVLSPRAATPESGGYVRESRTPRLVLHTD